MQQRSKSGSSSPVQGPWQRRFYQHGPEVDAAAADLPGTDGPACAAAAMSATALLPLGSTPAHLSAPKHILLLPLPLLLLSVLRPFKLRVSTCSKIGEGMPYERHARPQPEMQLRGKTLSQAHARCFLNPPNPTEVQLHACTREEPGRMTGKCMQR
eukprot:363784-Chlamydomonas_euryale.AAC.4